ncbi:MAG: YggS family pyridoxal phosphate-dependent enzyme [Actinomycetota bacterium]|nr:YggS family pyridoxal phosphate-dependent enzyme [Actinomycetota bacterium]
MSLVIAQNLRLIRDKMAKAASRVGRNPTEIKLVAVTKNVPVLEINQAIEAGITDIGENRVQEMRKKFGKLGNAVTWHFVGHLQTNKVKYIIDFVELIQSVDSLKLAQEIQKRAQKANRIQKVLVEVNVSREESKFGIDPQKLVSFMKEIAKLDHIVVKGLMTLAPLVEDTEEIRPVFRTLRELGEHVKELNLSRVEMEYLSMGMTNDFEIAIEEGSNMVRIGTGIFKGD